jgi:hypothetical protein
MRQDIPVSHKTSELRIAVAGEQFDTVGCHGGARICGGIVTFLRVSRMWPKRCNFFAMDGHGPPCGERWRRTTRNILSKHQSSAGAEPQFFGP